MKNTLLNSRIWLVGGSQGIGLALTQRLLTAGAQLVVSARSAEQNADLLALQGLFGTQLRLLNCDVTQTNSAVLQQTIDQAWSVYNGLDSWIYNAGAYHAMPVADWDVQQFEQMNQVNYLGAVRLMVGLMPKFNAQLSLHESPLPLERPKVRWMWNISLSSDFGLPYGGGYSAPKAALQNLAESLQPELRAQGIVLQVVNHGFVNTRLTAKNDFAMLGLMEPDAAAQRIVAALCTERFETRFPFNLAFVLALLKRLPKSWALALTKRMLHGQ
ncbi:SDR family NAD(P)-dependent oxidoreductase [Thiomicrorhabdus aquaedulcis]|uniref:SDR family NAD(P)-dependent oxidoreductase n=1 Tax=Thiomicrorhabdus aquaedulcis TaxID=2211106 RepID=UPI000FD6F628|nr:SDR family NAD(P)-dependent oxidoreductase [Thiomicrorhabdus aquaedulcis]